MRLISFRSSRSWLGLQGFAGAEYAWVWGEWERGGAVAAEQQGAPGVGVEEWDIDPYAWGCFGDGFGAVRGAGDCGGSDFPVLGELWRIICRRGFRVGGRGR